MGLFGANSRVTVTVLMVDLMKVNQKPLNKWVNIFGKYLYGINNKNKKLFATF